MGKLRLCVPGDPQKDPPQMRKRQNRSLASFLLPGSRWDEPAPVLGDEKELRGTEGIKLLPVCSPDELRGLVVSFGVCRG